MSNDAADAERDRVPTEHPAPGKAPKPPRLRPMANQRSHIAGILNCEPSCPTTTPPLNESVCPRRTRRLPKAHGHWQYSKLRGIMSPTPPTLLPKAHGHWQYS